jgi:hypothetical protein
MTYDEIATTRGIKLSGAVRLVQRQKLKSSTRCGAPDPASIIPTELLTGIDGVSSQPVRRTVLIRG